NKLESVYSCNIKNTGKGAENFSYETTERKAPAIKVAKPRVLIPAFPGTNCEYDSAKAVRDAGAEPEIIVINNLSADGISRSVEKFADELRSSQMIFIPGGFSGGDEPDGSGKFITAFFRNAAIKEGVTDLLENRDGLMCGICNGFQALIKLGLVPYGKIIDTDENCPTLTFNTIARHQSRIVRTRISSNKSPWLALTQVGDIYSVPISHGEGRFLASDELIAKLAANGQIATQYVDLDGNASNDIHFNPNDSVCAIEGITSPDGRVFGKMGHSERIGKGLYKNVPGDYNIRMFEAAVKYFK
ncbi:MAG: phosphoribosylformylglycinamidine synthase subunit PurQ, partial [Acutalibacteraceae bacterium]|nr:phosphoribosylformylglycinamidine synthase subunit PurQ [Acutalibacteraceae bacterium]